MSEELKCGECKYWKQQKRGNRGVCTLLQSKHETFNPATWWRWAEETCAEGATADSMLHSDPASGLFDLELTQDGAHPREVREVNS